MTLPIKIILITFLLIIVYFWNKFVPEKIVKSIGTFHRESNASNIDKQPIKFALKYEDKIIAFFKYFNWFGFLALSYAILTNQIN